MSNNQNNKKTKPLAVLIVRNQYVFPRFNASIGVGRQASINALRYAYEHKMSEIILVNQTDPDQENPTAKDVYQYGVIVKVKLKADILEKTSVDLKVESLHRVKLSNLKMHKKTTKEACFIAEAEILDPLKSMSAAEIRSIGEIIEAVPAKITELLGIKKANDDKINLVDDAHDKLSFLSFLLDGMVQHNEDSMKPFEKQHFLELFALNDRVNFILKEKPNLLMMWNENNDDEPFVRKTKPTNTKKQQETKQNSQIKKDINDKLSQRIRDKMDQQQKEFFLREKLKAIKEELGEIEDNPNDLQKYIQRLDTEPFPDVIKQRVKSEISRVEQLPAASSEANLLITYIDWLMAIPWHERSKEKYNLKYAQKKLDENHYGLKKIKERIIEYLAVKILSQGKDVAGQIICLVGPPGVGKTSLAKSIAEATNRHFVRIALGGIKDESEIRGHRKTYIGAMPGRIIQTMKRAKTVNPLFLLDEIDKMSSDYRGDPASAMLEVLDPEQNKAFSDHYIEEYYDLSNVMFIATANYYENIPEALIDRMEIIQLYSYTEIEKLAIAQKHLVKKVLAANTLTKAQLKFTANGLREIIKFYTREAGVRQLERSMNAIARKFIVHLLAKDTTSIKVTPQLVNEYLGKRIFEHTEKDQKPEIGVVNGLAYTQFGGDILPIEVNYFPGKGNLELTGKLGEIMRESASIALDYLKANAEKYEIDPDLFTNNDIHIHVPEGAVPKDGPSAGITLTTALLSALNKKAVSPDIGMTGEITLRGNVLPIGGLREKSISALRSGLKTIIIPQKNQKDLEDIPEEVKNKLQIHFVNKYQDVHQLIFRL